MQSRMSGPPTNRLSSSAFDASAVAASRLKILVVDKSIALSLFASPLLLLTACSADEEAAPPAPPDETVESAPAPATTHGGFIVRNATRIGSPILSANFEDASPQCDDWTSEGGIGIRSIPPRSGDYACKVCSTGEAPVLALANATGALDAGHYVLQAWVRARTPSVQTASVVLEAASAGGVARAEGAAVAVGADYAKLEVALDVPAAIDVLKLRIQAPAAKSECVLVDDVALVKR